MPLDAKVSGLSQGQKTGLCALIGTQLGNESTGRKIGFWQGQRVSSRQTWRRIVLCPLRGVQSTAFVRSRRSLWRARTTGSGSAADALLGYNRRQLSRSVAKKAAIRLAPASLRRWSRCLSAAKLAASSSRATSVMIVWVIFIPFLNVLNDVAEQISNENVAVIGGYDTVIAKEA
jgi:hypothetical protein